MSKNNNDREDRIEMTGEVIEALPASTFNVKIDNSDSIVIAVLAGKMRQNNVRVLPSDKVIVHVSPYDLTRGRIVRRIS